MSALTHSARHALSNLSYATTGMALITDSGGRVEKDLWIGSLATAVSGFVKSEGIKTIINLSGVNYDVGDVEQIRIDIADRFVNLELIELYMDMFEQIADHIRDAVAKGPTLVHCAMGINRSAASIVYYLVREGNTYMEALHKVTMANNIRGAPTLTNLSFRHLIKTYETVCTMKSGGVIVGSPGYVIRGREWGATNSPTPLFVLEQIHQRDPDEPAE